MKKQNLLILFRLQNLISVFKNIKTSSKHQASSLKETSTAPLWTTDGNAASIQDLHYAPVVLGYQVRIVRL